SVLTACDPDFSNPVGDTSSYSSGTADFSTFVALGDSLTAGYADGALYRHGQENSYGAILAQQFALVGGGAFLQPLMPVEATGSLNFGGFDVIADDRYLLYPTGDPESPVGPARLSDVTPSLVISTDISSRLTGPFNNMGVPGAKAYHLGILGYGESSVEAIGAGTASPYFSRFSSSDDTSMIADAAGQIPSFFVLWAGNNDILSYATGGGVGTDQTGNSDVTTYAANDITDPGVFTSGGTGGAAGLPSYPALVAA
ncbi:MAG: G-D-S-L family lipolytic protein, partial [Desulfobacterales bacterium]|nr:G-D-S-L family lipolytic protein [Desulfobacterales bacterium]